MSVNYPEYAALTATLQQAAIPLSPAELHGMLSGSLCVGDAWQGESWFEQALLSKDASNPCQDKTQCRENILQLYRYTSEQLCEMSFGFQLMLPDDEQLLRDRVEALSDWCRGIITALKLAGIQMGDAKSDDARDALLYLHQVVDIDLDSVSISEEDERAYVDAVEYVRLAVVMLYSEWQGAEEMSDIKRVVQGELIH